MFWPELAIFVVEVGLRWLRAHLSRWGFLYIGIIAAFLVWLSRAPTPSKWPLTEAQGYNVQLVRDVLHASDWSIATSKEVSYTSEKPLNVAWLKSQMPPTLCFRQDELVCLVYPKITLQTSQKVYVLFNNTMQLGFDGSMRQLLVEGIEHLYS